MQKQLFTLIVLLSVGLSTTVQSQQANELELLEHHSCTKVAEGCRVDTMYSYDQFNTFTQRSIFQYDTQGNESTRLIQNWDGSVWENDKQITYTYSLQGDLEIKLEEEWISSQWRNDIRTTYLYAQVNMIKNTREEWIGSQWTYDSRTNYTYDGGNLDTETKQDWDNNQWQDDEYSTYVYDMDGNLSMETSQDWDGSGWENSSLITLDYNGQGYLATITSQGWDGNTWQYSLRINHAYNGANLTDQILQDWDGNAWNNYYRYAYSYDSQDNIIERIHQNWNGSGWVMQYRDEFVYNCNSLGIAEASNTFGLSLWPNPAISELRMSVAAAVVPTTIAVYTISGQQVLRQAYAPQLNISALSAGIYFLELSGNNELQRQRFVKM